MWSLAQVRPTTLSLFHFIFPLPVVPFASSWFVFLNIPFLVTCFCSSRSLVLSVTVTLCLILILNPSLLSMVVVFIIIIILLCQFNLLLAMMAVI